MVTLMGNRDYDQFGGSDAGTVRTSTQTVRYFDVVLPADVREDEISEYIIRVNGKIVKRCSPFQARQLGLIER